MRTENREEDWARFGSDWRRESIVENQEEQRKMLQNYFQKKTEMLEIMCHQFRPCSSVSLVPFSI